MIRVKLFWMGGGWRGRCSLSLFYTIRNIPQTPLFVCLHNIFVTVRNERRLHINMARCTVLCSGSVATSLTRRIGQLFDWLLTCSRRYTRPTMYRLTLRTSRPCIDSPHVLYIDVSTRPVPLRPVRLLQAQLQFVVLVQEKSHGFATPNSFCRGYNIFFGFRVHNTSRFNLSFSCFLFIRFCFLYIFLYLYKLETPTIFCLFI